VHTASHSGSRRFRRRRMHFVCTSVAREVHRCSPCGCRLRADDRTPTGYFAWNLAVECGGTSGTPCELRISSGTWYHFGITMSGQEDETPYIYMRTNPGAPGVTPPFVTREGLCPMST